MKDPPKSDHIVQAIRHSYQLKELPTSTGLGEEGNRISKTYMKKMHQVEKSSQK